MHQNLRSIRRRTFLFGLGSLATIGTIATGRNIYKYQQIQALDDPQRDFTVSQELSLKQRAAQKGLIYGVAGTKMYLSSNNQYVAAIIKDCSMIVPEWEFKWTAGNVTLRPNADSFDFTGPDWMVNFAKIQNLLLRGHTLVWHDSLPPWLKETITPKNAESLLTSHIQTCVKRYAGKIHSWDVVNEIINLKDHRDDGLRIHPWLQTLGDNYIDLAFRLTSASDPQALLAYNEFGLDYDNQEQEKKRTAVLKLLERLKSQGTPIHALGIQAHLSPAENKFSPKKFRDFLHHVASLGLKIMITELDIVDKYLPLDITIRDRIVAAAYEDYLSVALDEKAVIAVISWGLSDRYSWLADFEPRPDGASVRPLPLDTQMRPKLAWNAIARCFDNAPSR